jgi:hypothetical protein
MNISSNIISGEDLNLRLSKVLPETKSLIVVSAYITNPAINWLIEHINIGCSVIIVGRLIPQDFINGASDISGLKSALLRGWSVKHLAALHAKIYLCDESRIFIGSANLTTNGLKIFGHGNLEACIEIPPGPNDIGFVKNIILAAQSINQETLDKMENFISARPTNDNNTNLTNKWPEDIFPPDRSIWVYDFPWANQTTKHKSSDEELKHDSELLGVQDLSIDTSTAKAFKETKAFLWLVEKLNESKSEELYYGKLTELLHDELKDDPTPYRRDVKNLLSNLLSYCQKYTQDSLTIDRPSHSQRIKLTR